LGTAKLAIVKGKVQGVRAEASAELGFEVFNERAAEPGGTQWTVPELGVTFQKSGWETRVVPSRVLAVANRAGILRIQNHHFLDRCKVGDPRNEGPAELSALKPDPFG
jgi:hypothetical protein